jgi:protoporphyrinogen/coproporphyrinogen III oxidase
VSKGTPLKKVAIVGGGISAFACAVALKEKGIDFTLFEREPRPGGKLMTERLGDFIVEAGPDSFLPEKHWTVELIDKVGLRSSLLPSNDRFKGTYIYSNGRLHPLPEGVMLMVPTMFTPLLRSSLISTWGKIRMGLELFVSRKQDDADESLAQFVSRRLGRECLEKIAEPLVAGIHTSNPDNMSVRATFPRFIEMERTHGSLIQGMVKAMEKAKPTTDAGKGMTYFMSLRGGMEELIEACARFIGSDNVQTGCQVHKIVKKPQGYSLLLDHRETSVDAVVLSTPSFVSKDIIGHMDPTLSDLLSLIEWSSTATISFGFPRKDIANLPGFGFIVPKIEGRRINATTWTSVKWSHRAPADSLLIRSFVGGGHHEELVDLGDEELSRIVLDELRLIAGITAEPDFFRIYRWRKSMPKYTVGHLDRLTEIDRRLAGHHGIHLIGCSYRGIGIGDCVKSGFDAAARIEENVSAER